MELIDKNSVLWKYMSEGQRGLMEEGEILVNDLDLHPDYRKVSDYSYLVFPFAKAYEGFIKQLLLDLDLITEAEYYSDDIRIGKILNPRFIKNKKSVYGKMCLNSGRDPVSDRLWNIWKRGRNQVFHYFPHNFRKLDYSEAIEIIKEIIDGMHEAVGRCSVEIKEEISTIKN